MMMRTTKWPAFVLNLALLALLAGCGPTKPDADNWKLPKKQSASAGMLVGRIDYPDSKAENPDRLMLNLRNVEFRDVKQAVRFGNRGEENFILSNNYFVVPNLTPGTYRFISFRAGNVHHSMRDAKFTYDVGAGQIKFVGSLDYVDIDPSTLRKIGNALSNYKKFEYSVNKAAHPTELEIFQWLNRTSAGSGWEPAIQKRIRELGGKP